VSRPWLVGILILVGVLVFASQGLKGGPEVTVREAAALLKGNPPPVLVDLRERAAFEQGRIAGARSVPADEFKAQLAKLKLPKFDAIILYDEDDTRAREATKLLYESGYQGALTLKGGMAAWREAAQQVEKPQPAKAK
jgi:rhodanese-related sulfurtransferase